MFISASPGPSAGAGLEHSTPVPTHNEKAISISSLFPPIEFSQSKKISACCWCIFNISFHFSSLLSRLRWTQPFPQWLTNFVLLILIFMVNFYWRQGKRKWNLTSLKKMMFFSNWKWIFCRKILSEKNNTRDFPGGSALRSPHFQLQGVLGSIPGGN